MNNTAPATPNTSVGLAAFLGDIAAVIKRLPAAWVRCELHSIKVTDRYVRMEFIEVDRDGAQIAKVQGGCSVAAWRRIEADFNTAGLALAAGSQVLVKLAARLNPVYGFQVDVQDIDLTFALGDLNARLQAIRTSLQDAGIWNQNRSLLRPTDFVRVSVIAPPGAAGLGDFRSTADRLAAAGLATFTYYEVPFQTREAPRRIVDALRDIYRLSADEERRSSAVAIIRGGGASADLAWLVDQKLAEAVCRMNVPVITGIGHERDRNLLDEIACIPCDTPSKVVEHIHATITHAALEGHRAIEAIRAQSADAVSRYEAQVNTTRNCVERDATETLRRAEATVQTVATDLNPRVRMLLDLSKTTVLSARTAVANDARETIRLADITVRTAATALEPQARTLLDQTQSATAAVVEQARAAARDSRELADRSVISVRSTIARSFEAMMRPLEHGTAKAMGEILSRLDVIPQTALDDVERLHLQIVENAGRVIAEAGDGINTMRNAVIRDALNSVDACQSVIAVVRECANALDPRSVLAAGYVILRDPSGSPLTDVTAVKAVAVITAEMRDGSIALMLLPPKGLTEPRGFVR